ncbi:unnamed protein product, partial [Strongylus vulgaris]
AVPLFNNSFIAPILTPINLQPLDDEYLGENRSFSFMLKQGFLLAIISPGPLEGAVESGAFLHNFTSFNMSVALETPLLTNLNLSILISCGISSDDLENHWNSWRILWIRLRNLNFTLTRALVRVNEMC